MNNQTILVVEDEINISNVIKVYLKKEGYMVITVFKRKIIILESIFLQ